MENADISQRAVYEDQAKEIDRIQKEILALAQKEESYDVFICYKETDASGSRTQDSVIANDIYHQLTQEGFKVFYAAITLEGKLGSAYEPIIFAALNSAKVMLAIGTKPEYFNAVWVKNEWSRFLKIIAKDRSKLLIPCYRDMDAYELPEEFAHLQAQDMGKIGFINDVVRGIQKVIKKDEPKQTTVVKETLIKSTTNANIVPLLKRAFMFLEDGEWDRADDFCEQVLNIDPECAEAYLGKLMTELRVNDRENLKNQKEPFDSYNNYKKTIRFADVKLKNTLIDYIEHINTRNENDRLEEIHTRAKRQMATSNSERSYKEVAAIFESISEYKDSATLAKECYYNAEIKRKDAILSAAKRRMIGKDVSNYKDAIETFKSISGWKDADEQIIVCQNKIEEIKKIIKCKKLIVAITIPTVCVLFAFFTILETIIIPNVKYNNALKLMNDGKYVEAISQFEAMDGYNDSEDKIIECNYNNAITLMDSGNITDAYNILIELNGYKDSAEKANSIYTRYMMEKIKTAKVGDYVFFGTYEQDNKTSNGKENIEWLVLDVVDGKALLISKYALASEKYNNTSTDVTWENCTLRTWLNYDFINSAFSDEEKTKISTVTVSAHKNPDYKINPGNPTQDKVFLLSIIEANRYFTSNEKRECKATACAETRAYINSSNGNCFWRLRTPGTRGNVAIVMSDGSVSYRGNAANYDYAAIRPAMWIDLNVE